MELVLIVVPDGRAIFQAMRTMMPEANRPRTFSHLAVKQGCQADTVERLDLVRHFDAQHVDDRRIDVARADRDTGRAGLLDSRRPLYDARHTNAPFPQLPLLAAEGTVGTMRIGVILVEPRAVVAAEPN